MWGCYNGNRIKFIKNWLFYYIVLYLFHYIKNNLNYMGDFNRGGFRGGFNRGGDRGGFRGGRRDDRGGRGDRRDREDREMFDAVCSKCGRPCKLPFIPKTDKPVFCDSCFQSEKPEPRRDGGFSRGGERGSSNASNEKIDLLISKMDEVLGLLKQKTEEKPEPKKVKAEKKVEKEEKKTKVKKEKEEKKKTTKKASKK